LLNGSLRFNDESPLKAVMTFSPWSWEDSMKTKLMGLAVRAVVTMMCGASIVSAETAVVATLDSKPGPAYQMLQGKLAGIEGNVYVVEQSVDNYRGETVTEAVRVYVGTETKRLTGSKKVGDKIRMEVTRGGFANTIQ
jgi:hypothetical protein